MVELKKILGEVVSERMKARRLAVVQMASVQGGTSTKIILRYVGTSDFGSFGYSALFVEFSTPPSGRKWKFCLAAQNY